MKISHLQRALDRINSSDSFVDGLLSGSLFTGAIAIKPLSQDQRTALGTSVAGRTALLIYNTVLTTGATPDEATLFAILPAAESAYSPTAVAKKTKCAGYFQLHPKYWRTSGPTTSVTILRSQIQEMRTVHKGYTSDLATLYAHHFYPALGVAFRKYPIMGLQPGTKTYSQYAFADARGSVFHSPVIMAAHQVCMFEDLTGVSLDVTFPSFPSRVASLNETAGRLKAVHALDTSVISLSAATRFSVSTGAEPLQASEIVSLGSERLGDVGVITIPKEYRTLTSGQSSYLYRTDVSDARRSFDGASHDDEVFAIRQPDRFWSLAEYDANFWGPSLETLMYALRTRPDFDTSVMENLIIVCLPQLVNIPFLEQSERPGNFQSHRDSRRLSAYVNEQGELVRALSSLEDRDLGELLTSLLSYYIESSSVTIRESQMRLHQVAKIELDLSDDQDSGVETSLLRSQHLHELPWLVYNDVAYPFSLLVTPMKGEDLGSSITSVAGSTVHAFEQWVKGRLMAEPRENQQLVNFIRDKIKK